MRATVSVSYLFNSTPTKKVVYRVWYKGLIVGEYPVKEQAEKLKDKINGSIN